MTLPSPSHLNDDYWDKLKEANGEKDTEAYYTDAKPLGKTLPRKEKDPGSFTLPCFIKNMCYKALADLGASISVMPYSTYTTLGLGDLIPTKLIVELADRTMKRPKEIVENVLVEHRRNQVKDFVPTIEEGEGINEPIIEDIQTKFDNIGYNEDECEYLGFYNFCHP
ncbi:reverse transcriptase domain-containing protein [Tanacetum coccineum]|uniref:Reverse transcriptase domain-containing protein n=1 Tax=Tanacetum coccineum TaxID=301880 RepID=A0ABQ5HIU7_9ASTR